jgi:hypothetical protein
MPTPRKSLRAQNADLRAENKQLRRENRNRAERDLQFEERYGGPADIEGIGGRPGVIILRDKNMGEVKRIIDDLPNVPASRPDDDPDGPPLGFYRARAYVQNEVSKMVDSLVVVGPYNTALVRDLHRLRMWIYNRAGALLRPDIIGESTRFALLGLIEDVAFAPSVPHLFGISQETEVQPVEAERKGFD